MHICDVHDDDGVVACVIAWDCTGSDGLRRTPTGRQASLFWMMLSAVAYCHSKELCHRDLKLENFVFESKEPGAQLKLIDFGLSKKYVATLMIYPSHALPTRSQFASRSDGADAC